jgi:hypothetical protein
MRCAADGLFFFYARVVRLVAMRGRLVFAMRGRCAVARAGFGAEQVRCAWIVGRNRCHIFDHGLKGFIFFLKK